MSAVSVDVIPLRMDDLRLTSAAYRREIPPYTGELALPGVLLAAGERIGDAARRALTKIGVAADDVTGVGQVVVFDEPHRDPRGPTLSVVCWAAISDAGSSEGTWFDIHDAPTLAFDHNAILAASIPQIAQRLWRDDDLTRALTGERFAASRAVALTEALTGKAPDRGNLNRQLKAHPSLRATTERVVARGTGRPGTVWEWITPAP